MQKCKRVISLFMSLVLFITVIPITPTVNAATGDTFANAITIPLDQTINGTFDVAKQEVHYAFVAPVTGRYWIQSVGTGVPTYFYVYDNSQTFITQFRAEKTLDLTAGSTYYIRAIANTNTDTGAYSFSVTKPYTVDGLGGSFGTASGTALDTTISGKFNTPDKLDYYIFTVPVTGNYWIKSEGTGVKTYFYVYDNNQTFITQFASEKTLELTAGATYYLRASANTSTQTGDYAFSITTPYTFDGNGGSFDTASSTAVDTVITGQFNTPNKLDYYIFTAPVTGHYWITSEETGVSTYFYLYDNNRTFLTQGKSEITKDLTAGATYYLRAQSNTSSQTGQYSFSITVPYTVDGNGGSFATPLDTPMYTNISGKLNTPGKSDYYIFTATRTGKYQVLPMGTGITTYYYLYDNAQKFVTQGRNISYDLTAGNTYYLRVQANTSGTIGNYTLIVVDPAHATAPAPVITRQPVSQILNIRGRSNRLVVTVKAPPTGGKITYQWYRNSKNSTVGGTRISGATKQTYIAPTTRAGRYYYFCAITNTMPANIKSTKMTRTAYVNVRRASAATPSISRNPVSRVLLAKRRQRATIYVTARVTYGRLTYQWYSNTRNSTRGARIIRGATKRTYSIIARTRGTRYYFCRITNTDTGATRTKAVRYSRAARIVVR